MQKESSFKCGSEEGTQVELQKIKFYKKVQNAEAEFVISMEPAQVNMGILGEDI